MCSPGGVGLVRGGREVAPVVVHGGHGVSVQDGPDQGVHLGHVAAQPEQPAAGARQDQTNLRAVRQVSTCFELGGVAPFVVAQPR